MKSIKVLIADDHRMFIDGLIALLTDAPEITILGTASNGAEAIELVDAHTDADILIMDISMPVMDGIQAMKQLNKSHPDIKILALTQNVDKGSISRALKAGIAGYIVKNSRKEEFIEAVRAISRGESYFSDQMKDALVSAMNGTAVTESSADQPASLTEREKDILKLIAMELTSNEIAAKLYISPYTVETHRKNLIQKLGVRNSAGLVKMAVRLGLVEDL